MTPRTQLIFQNEIDNLIFETELNGIVNYGARLNYISPGYISPEISQSSSNFLSNNETTTRPFETSEGNTNIDTNSDSIDTLVTYNSNAQNVLLG